MLADRIDQGRLAELATRRSAWTGHLTTVQLPRLAILLAEDATVCLDISVRFAPAEHGVAELGLEIGGSLQLVCQRCLEPLEWRVDCREQLTVLADEEDARYLDDPFESVLIGAAGLELARVAEDELLAAVPMAPVHVATAGCSAPEHHKGVAAPAPVTSRPFAGLAALMKVGQGPTD